jgi:ParB/RepB/Spo0J family partition protein
MSKYLPLADYVTLEIPIKVIYFDRAFNSRGVFTPQSCIDLADSMQAKGLKIPIIVQPREDARGVPKGFEYRIIAGHRRYTAAKLLLQWANIPATVVTGLSESDARVTNLIENLARKNLTLYQEAVALRHTFPEPISYEKMAKEVSKSSSWCRIRWRLLDSPLEVQDLAKKGILSATDLRYLTYKTPDEQVRIAAEIEVAQLHGESLLNYRRKNCKAKRARNLRDIDEMLTMLMAKGAYPDPYKALSWAAGRIPDEELLN